MTSGRRTKRRSVEPNEDSADAKKTIQIQTIYDGGNPAGAGDFTAPCGIGDQCDFGDDGQAWTERCGDDRKFAGKSGALGGGVAKPLRGALDPRTVQRKNHLFIRPLSGFLLQPDSANPGEFLFAAWIDGYDWIQLPTKTCAHPVFEQDYATLSGSRPTYNVDLIKNIPVFDSGSDMNCTGIVFAPTGRLANYNDVMIQAYTALPNADSNGKPDMRDLGIKFSDDIQGPSFTTRLTSTRLPYRRWCVSINKFTGRTEVTYAQPPEK